MLLFYINYCIIHLNIILMSFLCVFFAAHIKQKPFEEKQPQLIRYSFSDLSFQTHCATKMQFAICILAQFQNIHLMCSCARLDISDATLLFCFSINASSFRQHHLI